MSQKEHYQVYPTGSCAGKFYGTARIHKLSPDGNLRCIDTANYQLAKYLTQLLLPLA